MQWCFMCFVGITINEGLLSLGSLCSNCPLSNDIRLTADIQTSEQRIPPCHSGLKWHGKIKCDIVRVM